MTLAAVKRIIDITVGEDGGFKDSTSPVFSLLCRQVTDSREKLYTFQVQDSENNDKRSFMDTLAKSIATSSCRTDCVSVILTLDCIVELTV